MHDIRPCITAWYQANISRHDIKSDVLLHDTVLENISLHDTTCRQSPQYLDNWTENLLHDTGQTSHCMALVYSRQTAHYMFLAKHLTESYWADISLNFTWQTSTSLHDTRQIAQCMILNQNFTTWNKTNISPHDSWQKFQCMTTGCHISRMKLANISVNDTGPRNHLIARY